MTVLGMQQAGCKGLVEGRAAPRERYQPRHVVNCTPGIATGHRMREYIAGEVRAPKKQWFYEILDGTREAANVIHNEEDFMVVPDLDNNNPGTANWLVLFKDLSLHSIRDLRGEHVALLEHVRDTVVRLMGEARGYTARQVMCFFHYLPSVFQLHLHVCAPYGQYTTADVIKVHAVDTVVSNLRIDSDFYLKATLTTVVIQDSELAEIYYDT